MEEDIKILENKVKQWEPYKNIKFKTEIEMELQKENRALENILIELKGTKIDLDLQEKENEKLRVRNKELEEKLKFKETFDKLHEHHIKVNFIPKDKIIEQLDKLDLDYEEQESWDELNGSAAVTLFCKQLLKGE